ncbi:MAG: hypothetical protein ACP5HS_05105 [Anaerolineae bacterium]
MPFAKKFRAMMDFPLAGETIGDFTVERIEVDDVAGDFGQHGYAVRMILSGPGGKQGVRRALAELLSARPVTFSSYGNPYQLWCGRPEVESLGDKRYAVTARGAGVPIALDDILARFLGYLEEQGLLAGQPDEADLEELLTTYLNEYRGEIRRNVGRYRGQVRRRED